MRFWDNIKGVKEGDILFLHNVETDVLFGPFIAKSNGGLNIEPEAWGGRFQAQVKVGWKVISIIQKASKRFPFLRAPGVKLSDDQGEEY